MTDHPGDPVEQGGGGAQQGIVLTSGATSWSADYIDAEEYLRELLGGAALIEPVGSAAVPGLAAKPILDILLGFATPAELSAATGRLVDAGYALGDPPKLDESVGFLSMPRTQNRPAINLHLAIAGQGQWRDLLTFRESLRADPALARQYEDLKRTLAALVGGDLVAYTAGKSDFINEVLTEARRLEIVDGVLGHQRAKLGRATVYRACSIVSQLVIAIVAATSVFFNDGLSLLVIAIIGAAVLPIWLRTDWLVRRCRSEGEEARRIVQISYGLALPISDAPTSPGKSVIRPGQSVRLYFATIATPGPQRVAEMVDESAFFAGAVQRLSGALMLILLGAAAVVAFVWWIGVPGHWDADGQINAVRVLIAMAVFLLSSDIVGAAVAHFHAATTMADIRTRLARTREDGFPQGDVLHAMTDYNAAVEGAPLGFPGAFELGDSVLTRRWALYKARYGIGLQG